jgi:hypothetical protein
MKSIATIILGLLLVVSAAAGNSNTANVAATSNMAGQEMVNADFVQVSDIEADLLGNSICAEQISNMEAIDNTLVGSEPDGNTFFLQSIDQSISDTGNNNVDTQNVGIPGTIKKVISIVDCDDSFNSGLIALDNTLTGSVSNQMISQNDMDTGNSNEVTQLADMKMNEDILTKAGALQKIDENVYSLGDANTFSQDVAFTSKANIVTDGNIVQQAYTSSS